MAKARQVGTPHSLQLVFGNNLKIWIPVNAMGFSLSHNFAESKGFCISGL
jgi:hypothetical protein